MGIRLLMPLVQKEKKIMKFNTLLLIGIIFICFNCKSNIEGGWEIIEIKGEMKDSSLYGKLIIFTEYNNCYFPDEINLNCKYSFADNKLNINSRNPKLNGSY